MKSMLTVIITLGLAAWPCAGSQAVAGTSPADTCKDAKADAAGKKAAGLLEAYGKNIKKADALKLSSDVSKAQSKLTKAFVRAEGRGGCAISGDAAAIEAKVDAFVLDIVNGVSGTTTTTIAPTTTTTIVPTTTTTIVPTTTTTTLGPGGCNVGETTSCGGTCPNSGSCLQEPGIGGECFCTPSECDLVVAGIFPLCVGNCGVSGGGCGCASVSYCGGPACSSNEDCPLGQFCNPRFPQICLGGTCTTAADCSSGLCICYSGVCACQ